MESYLQSLNDKNQSDLSMSPAMFQPCQNSVTCVDKTLPHCLAWSRDIQQLGMNLATHTPVPLGTFGSV